MQFPSDRKLVCKKKKKLAEKSASGQEQNYQLQSVAASEMTMVYITMKKLARRNDRFAAIIS